MNVWQVFAEVAARHPERAAVEVLRRDRLDAWTYAQLHGLAEDRARGLAAAGVGPGDRCAILADNDAHWCAAYLGILRLGAIAVPLDTNYSAEQTRTILTDSGATVLFSGGRLLPTAREALADLPGVLLADVHETPNPASPELGRGESRAPNPETGGLPSCPSAPSDTAVILYTSGTTADPKGVMLSHGNLLAERDAAFEVVTVSERDSVLGVLPLFHALAQLANLLLPFAVGARVVFLESLNSTELLRALSERRITIFACVPQFFYLIHERITGQVAKGGMLARGVFRLLLGLSFRLRRLGVNAGPYLFGRVHRIMGRQMRLFVTGGSKFDPAVGRDLYALGFTILQAYGLTETSGAATITRPENAHLDTVGRALPGQEIRIMPPEAEEGSEPVDGEIAVRGPIVMQGYFNRPDATAAVMRDGWFLTGDLGRMEEDGRLTITGRKKEVIVLASGKNIHPEEVEAHYRQSAFIKEICVMGLAREDHPTGERLHAVVVPDKDMLQQRRIVNAGDLLRFEIEGLSIGLPSHKRVLGYDVWFDPLPRTTTGKLKRHEIQRRFVEKHREAREERAPGAEDRAWLAESHVASALPIVRARAKGGRAVAPDANLELDLGLDSMERVELLTELEQRFAVRVPQERLAEIFTVRQLVEAVRPGAGAAAAGVATDDSWAVLLRDLPPASDPMLGGLLDRRRLSAPILFVATRLLRMLIARTEVTGLEHLPARGPFVVSPNHQSYIDPFVVCGVLPYRTFRELFFVGAAEYFETPLMRWIARQCNCVPVDPDANLVPAMKAGAFGLSHGKVLMLFPEGERSIDGTVRRFKKGAPILSRHLGVPIVPVALDGVFEIWPRNRAIRWRRLLPGSGHRVRLSFGPPVRFDGSVSDAEAAASLRETVASLWDGLREDREAAAEVSA